MKLDDQQQAAVESKSKTSIVIASAGSGKTRVLVARIQKAIIDGVEPERIVVITFTNAGAKEIATRLDTKTQNALGYVGTLHGYMMNLLQKHGSQIGYRKTGAITILTPEAAEALMKRTKEGLGYPKCSAKETEAGYTDRAKVIRAQYRQAIKRENMVDYDQILVDGLRLLKKMNLFRPVVDLLLVDEAQDSAEIDWNIYGTIEAGQTFIVGDGDQSIFVFRGAQPGLFQCAAEAPGVTTYFLEHNYRSDIAICDAANRLIANNSNRIPKTIRPHSIRHGTVMVASHENSRNEQTVICNSIKEMISNYEPTEEIAVLALTNALVDEIRKELIQHGIPVARANRGEKLPDDWQFCLTTIQLMMDRQNNILAEAYLKGIGHGLTAMNRQIIESMKTGKSLASLTDLPEWKPNFQNLPELLAKAGVDATSVGLVAERLQVMPHAFPTMQDILSDLWRPDSWQPSEGVIKGVTVSTIHKSKGHEWNTVFIAGCEEGILPKLSKNEDIEESRRIFFVGVTRAKHRLILTHCARRFLYGKTVEQQPSRFLSEIQSNL